MTVRAPVEFTDINHRRVGNQISVATGEAIPVTDPGLEIARGNVAGQVAYSIVGRKDGVSQTVLDDISQIPTTTVIPDPGGIQMEVVSSSPNDANGGTGINSVVVHYLDSAGDEQEETILMNGVTPVNTVSIDFNKIQWMHAKTVGGITGKIAAGNISLRDTAGVTTYEYIAAGGNQSLSCRYHIPTGKTGFIQGWIATAIEKQVDFRLRATVDKSDMSLLADVFLFQDAAVLQNTSSSWRPFPVPKEIPAGATIKVSGLSSAAGGNAGVSFDVLLIDN